jgi:hypothetical protein
MNGIPEELAGAIERAAATVPRHGGDIDGVLRRHRIRRQRRAWAAVVTAAALVALTAGAAPILIDTSVPAGPTPVASEVRPAKTTPQRLILAPSTTGGLMPKGQSGVLEVLPDGSLINHPVSGLGRGYRAAGLPDGRLVVLTGDAGRGSALVVLRADGTVQHRFVLPVFPAWASFVAATEQEAYLLTSSGLVARDLATGHERTVLGAAAVGVGLHPRMDVATDMADDRFAIAALPGKTCQLQVLAMPTGRKVSSPAPGAPDCRQILAVRLSNDGRRLAVAYRRVADVETVRVAVVDTGTGRVRLDSPIPTQSRKRPFEVLGMAWSDPDTVRVAWTGLPPTVAPRGPDLTKPLQDQLQITPFTS